MMDRSSSESTPQAAAAESQASRPIEFAGATLHDYRHVCAFFDSEEEEARVMLPFVKDGVDRGEKAFHIIDPDDRASYTARLEAAGIRSAHGWRPISSSCDRGTRPNCGAGASIRMPCSR